jgi:hypothetical protein
MKNIEGCGSASGSIGQRHGSADPDPDPHRNVMDPQHCFLPSFFRSTININVPLFKKLRDTIFFMSFSVYYLRYAVKNHSFCLDHQTDHYQGDGGFRDGGIRDGEIVDGEIVEGGC